ncbi:hypothetical protein EGO53_28315 (plasmid) [Serratia liquefaciens]|uniref:Uncharacterized protein n=1 Tax=Serratia liquefaciens TaxID=614 RepID=A0A515D5L9_SERLI|nr:hypothetical protein EGO53_28315 [Serratia liquefaciens]
MEQSLQGGREQEKGIGASRLTPLACSLYVGVSATVGMRHLRAAGPSGGTGVDVRLALKDG